MIKKQIDNKYFKQLVKGTDPITKGHFTIDWAFINNGWEYIDGWEEKLLSAVGQITIDGNDSNPFYDALVKTPLLIQDHPLGVDFLDGMRFIKITSIGQWQNYDREWMDENKWSLKIVLLNVEFEFLDNLNYLENIQTFKINNLL